MASSELRTKIGKREETVRVVETLPAFAMAAFYFAVVTGGLACAGFQAVQRSVQSVWAALVYCWRSGW